MKIAFIFSFSLSLPVAISLQPVNNPLVSPASRDPISPILFTRFIVSFYTKIYLGWYEKKGTVIEGLSLSYTANNKININKNFEVCDKSINIPIDIIKSPQTDLKEQKYNTSPLSEKKLKAYSMGFFFGISEFIDNMTFTETLSITYLLLSYIIIKSVISMTIVLYGDSWIILLNLENRCPKLAKWLQARTRLQYYYLIVNICWIFAAILLMMVGTLVCLYILIIP